MLYDLGGYFKISDFKENAIEFVKGSKTACVTLSSQKYANRVRKLLDLHPGSGEILWDSGGILTAHIPTAWIKFSSPREMSEERRQEMSERLAAIRKR